MTGLGGVGVGILLIALAGGALRFATLDTQSIWLDESATMILVHRGFSGMLSHLSSSESTPPLYYVLVWAWTKVFGTGPVGFRSFSAFVGTLTIPFVGAIARRSSARAGLWAAALAALSPAMYYYSQEARAYALLILFCAAALLCWQRAQEQPSGGRLAWWGLMSALALLTHYFAVFLFIPQAWLLARRLGVRRVAPAVAGVVLVGIALLPLAVAERSDGKASWIEGNSLANRAAETVKQLLVGLYGPLEPLTAAAAGLLAAGAVALVVRRGEQRERAHARDMALIAGVALAIPLLLALVHLLDVFDGRNEIAVWVPAAALVAAGLGLSRAPRLGAALGVALCAVFVAVIAVTDVRPGYQRDDWRGAAEALGRPVAGQVLVTPHFGSAPLSIYLGSLRGRERGSVQAREVEFVALRMRRTGRSPSAPALPAQGPPGFTAAGKSGDSAWAVGRWRAPSERSVSVAELRRLAGDAEAEAVSAGG